MPKQPSVLQPHQFVPGLDFPFAYTQAGQGEILVLVHGSLCDYRYWRPQLSGLSTRLHVVAPSLRGYWPEAFTQEDRRFTIAQHAHDLSMLIKHLGKGRPVHVLGHSRGAHVALVTALNYPHCVQSLILADPGFQLEHESHTYDYLERAALELQQGDREGALQRFIDTVNGEATWSKMVSWFKEMVRDNAGTLLSQAQEPAKAFPLDAAANITCPVLLLGGRNSPARYGKIMDALQSRLPCAKRDTIALAAHGMNLANPRAFNARVVQFIEGITAQSYSPV